MPTLVARGLVLAALLAPCLAARAHAGAGAAASPGLLLESDYPVEVSLSFPAALLHWLDSLAALGGAGMTAGKTVEAHRLDFEGVLGPPDAEDLRLLQRFRDVRIAVANRTAATDRHALTRAFFGAVDLDDALGLAGALLDERERTEFDAAIRHFARRYGPLWNEPNAASAFLIRALNDDRRLALGEFLSGLARFYGVPAGGPPHPRVVLVPVRPGHGTHAQAIGRFLLIEIRPGEHLADQVAPIVHENAHFLFDRIETRRAEELERVARDLGPRAEEAWHLLREALPTALAQGVADQRLGRGDWSTTRPWYHLEAVDAYAKSIYPLVSKSLRRGGKLDGALVRKLLRAGTPGR